jgi:Family of unknown function (DUF6492)
MLDRVHVVTPVPAQATRVLDGVPGISVRSDGEVCPEAATLGPWFRQQYIKLHADRISDKQYIVCLGADTLIIRPLGVPHLFGTGGRPVIRFFRYGRPNPHLRFERGRVRNVARLLNTQPRRSFLLGDFICDLFLFDRELLRALRAHLGPGRLLTFLDSLGRRQGWDDRFGEWTAYSVFALDVIGADVDLRLGTPEFFRQIHTDWEMASPTRYDGSVVHFAWKPRDVRTVLDDLAARGLLPPPGRPPARLAGHPAEAELAGHAATEAELAGRAAAAAEVA